MSSVWGTELFQFIAAQAILHQDDLKKRMNLSYSLHGSGAIHPILHIVLVQFVLFFKSGWFKIAMTAIFSRVGVAAIVFS